MDLYSEIILDHHKNPRHRGTIEAPSIEWNEKNPTCGDSVTIALSIDKQGVVTDFKYTGVGCAISTAGSDMLAEEVLSREMVGRTLGEVAQISNETMYDLLGVEISPARVKCALLGLSCLREAIKHYQAGQPS